MTKKFNKYLKQTHYGDIECVGFWEDVNTIDDVHCLCSITEDDEVILWHDKPELDGAAVWDDVDKKEYTIPPRAGSLIEGFRYWYKIGNNGGKLSVHNTATYDMPIIEKIVPQCKIPFDCWRDTFIQSKMQWFDRPCPKGAKSAHGLQAYGIKFGVKKPPITDFTKFDAYILHRVIEDCRIQKKTQIFLDSELISLNKIGVSFDEAYKVEYQYALNCHKQEVRGALVDKPHILQCIDEWDEITENLAAELEPILPPSIRTAGKITRSELMERLGYKNIPEDDIVEYVKDGELAWKKKKPYVIPSTKFHKITKLNQYQGFDLSHGESPTFIKKKDLTDWIKANYPETKSKDWNITNVIKETKVLNAKTCEYFGVEEDRLDIICGPHTKVSFHTSKLTQHEVVKGYLIRYAGLKMVEEWNFKKCPLSGRIARAEENMTVSYPPKASAKNQLHFKVKRGQPIVTSPKLGENDYKQLTGDMGSKIAEYNTIMHRRRYLSNLKDPDNKGVLSNIRPDGRVPCGVNNFNTSTGRSSHRVIVNLPSEKSLMGKEMRQMIIASEGTVLVGADQKSSQLQLCAVVTNNTDYFNAVVKGKESVKNEEGIDIYQGDDAHTANAINFDLITRVEWKEAIDKQDPELIKKLGLLRGDAKAPAFSVLFGAGGNKVALLLGISVQEGNNKRQSFLDQLGLTGVNNWLEYCQSRYTRGNGFYIPVAFGYWVFCTSMHKACNYLIQGLEGVVQKVAVNYFEEQVIVRGWAGTVNKILDMHDEMLCECPPELAKEVGMLMEEAYTWTGVQLHDWYQANMDKYSGGSSLDILPDFNGSHAIGSSYYDCH